MGEFRFSIKAMLACSTGSFLFGYHLTGMTGLVDRIASDAYPCDPEEVLARQSVECMRDIQPGLNIVHRAACDLRPANCDRVSLINNQLCSIIFLGMIIGSAGMTRLMQQSSMMKLNHAAMFACVISTVTVVLAQSASSLLWGRFLVGVAVGSVVVQAPQFIIHLAPTKNRDLHLLFHRFSTLLGSFVSICLSCLVTPSSYEWFGVDITETGKKEWISIKSNTEQTWRFVVALPLIVVALNLILFRCWLPMVDTPKHLLKLRFATDEPVPEKQQKARKILRAIYDGKDIGHLEEEIIANNRKYHLQTDTFRGLMSTYVGYKRLTLSAMAIYCFNHVCGIYIIYALSNQTASYHQRTTVTWSPTLTSVVFHGLGLVFVLPSMLAVDYSSDKALLRRRFLIGSSCAMAICFTVMLSIQFWEPTPIAEIVLMCTFIVAYSCGYGPFSIVWLADTCPPWIIHHATPFAVCTGWLLVYVQCTLAHFIPTKLCLYAMLFIINSGGFIILTFLVPLENPFVQNQNPTPDIKHQSTLHSLFTSTTSSLQLPEVRSDQPTTLRATSTNVLGPELVEANAGSYGRSWGAMIKKSTTRKIHHIMGANYSNESRRKSFAQKAGHLATDRSWPSNTRSMVPTSDSFVTSSSMGSASVETSSLEHCSGDLLPSQGFGLGEQGRRSDQFENDPAHNIWRR